MGHFKNFITLSSFLFFALVHGAPSRLVDGPATVDQVLSGVRRNALRTNVNSQVANWYPYKYDSFQYSHNIRDGGNDMYDVGNIVSFTVNGNRSFGENGVLYNNTYTDQKNYAFTTIASHPFMALMWVGEGATSIHVDGNAGADNSGVIERKEMPSMEWDGYKVDFAYSQVSQSSQDPSICEVYFLLSSRQHWNSMSEVTQFKSGDETNKLKSSYATTGENYLLGYVLLSKYDAEAVTDEEITNVIEELAENFSKEISNFMDVPMETTTQEATTEENEMTTEQMETTEETMGETTAASDEQTEEMKTQYFTTNSYEKEESTSQQDRTMSHGMWSMTDNSAYTTTEQPRPYYEQYPTNYTLNNGDYSYIYDFINQSQIDEQHQRQRDNFYSIVQMVNRTTTAHIQENMPRFFYYNYDGEDSIRDGGQDMFDTGNMVKFTEDNQTEVSVKYNKLHYSDDFMLVATTGHPFMTLAAASAMDGEVHRYNLTVHGNAGADGDGRVFSWKGNLTFNHYVNCYVEYNVFQLSLSADTDPSICELYFTVSCDQWGSDYRGSEFYFLSDGNELRSQYIVEGNEVLIGYMLLSKPLGSPLRSADVEMCINVLLIDVFSRQYNRPEDREHGRTMYVTQPMQVAAMNSTSFDNTYYQETNANPNSTEGMVRKILNAVRLRTAEVMMSFIDGYHDYYYDSYSGSSIADGGQDMFDDGNKVYFGKIDQVDYNSPNSSLANYNSVYNMDGYAYGTVTSHPFMAIMMVDQDPEDDNSAHFIEVKGNAGADGAGKITRMEGELTLGSFVMKYYVFQVHEATSDPSICEVYFVVYGEDWDNEGDEFQSKNREINFSHTQETENLWGVLKATGNKILLGYTLFSKKNGAMVEEQEIRSALQPLLLEIASDTSESPVLTRKAPQDDYLISPTCLLSETVNQFFDECFHGWTPKKYTGVDACRSQINELLMCGEKILSKCSWSLDSSNRPAIDIREIQKAMRRFANPISDRNTPVDEFCYHAPMGLRFPHQVQDFFMGFCDYHVASNIHKNMAQFYRRYVWSRNVYDINNAFNFTMSNINYALNDHSCNVDNVSYFSGREAGEVQHAFEVFKNTLKNIDIDFRYNLP